MNEWVGEAAAQARYRIRPGIACRLHGSTAPNLAAKPRYEVRANTGQSLPPTHKAGSLAPGVRYLVIAPVPKEAFALSSNVHPERITLHIEAHWV